MDQSTELPLSYLERVVEIWGVDKLPMYRATVLMWLHSIDDSGESLVDRIS